MIETRNRKQLVDQIKIQETTDCALQGTKVADDEDKNFSLLNEVECRSVKLCGRFTSLYFPKATRLTLALEMIFHQSMKKNERKKHSLKATTDRPMNKSWSFQFSLRLSFHLIIELSKTNRRNVPEHPFVAHAMKLNKVEQNPICVCLWEVFFLHFLRSSMEHELLCFGLEKVKNIKR